MNNKSCDGQSKQHVQLIMRDNTLYLLALHSHCWNIGWNKNFKFWFENGMRKLAEKKLKSML